MPTLNIPQASFLAMPHKFKAFVAGFGSGKTWVGGAGLCKHAWEHPGITSGYFAPTYPQIRDIFYPTIEEVAFDWGMSCKIAETNKEVSLFSGRVYRGTIICRSMDKPGSIVGFKIGHALVDELDVMARDKAQHAWRKIIARMRYNEAGLRNGVDVTTTPEGFKFVYEQFVKAVRDKPSLSSRYGLIHASTYDNEKNLPEDYIPSLYETYPANLIDAYLRGKFVNLTSGTIYHQFDRALNNSTETHSETETLYIGMDFNVGKMSGVIHVKRDGLPVAVDEIVNAYDTPDIIRIIKERYWRFDNGEYRKTREIRIYPDASGDSRKSVRASETDLQLLRSAGFAVVARNANPPVKDRINAMNAMFCNAEGARRYRVNVVRCPTYTECLEQQVWGANGEPDKTAGKDHACFSGKTMVQTPAGLFRFDELPETGFVLGPHGEYVPYHSAGKTGNEVTVRVDFADGYFVECTQDHEFLVGDGSWVKASELTGRECVSLVKSTKSSMGLLTTYAANILPTLRRWASDGFTGRYGSHTAVKYLKDSTSITSTEIAATIKLKTWLACWVSSICESMEKSIANEFPRWEGYFSRAPRLGMRHQRGWSGIVSNINAHPKGSALDSQLCALAAEIRSWLPKASKTALSCTVQKHVRPTHAGRARLTMLVASAVNAAARSSQTSTAPGRVVKNVSLLGEQSVYCLTVPEYGAFKLDSSSPVVSNCDAGGYFIFNDYPLVKPAFGIKLGVAF